MEKRRRMRRKFSAEFKAETVRLVQSGGKSIADVVRDLDLTRSAVERWVKEAEIEAGRGPEGALKRAEREELVRLRRENERLRMEREILKKATAFFAKEHA
jgi:transposase